LVAEIFLQRTRAEQVEPVYRKFTKRFPEPAKLARSSVRELSELMKPLGLAWRAELLHQLSDVLVSDYSGIVPNQEDKLLKLPGVGSYIASAYLCFHCGRCTEIVDNNVVRFYGRLFGFDTNAETRRSKAFRQLAREMISKRSARKFNYALLDFTRKVCAPQPRHKLCPFTELCEYHSSHPPS